MRLELNINQIKSKFSNNPIIENFHLTKEKPGLVWIYGPNGTGKSLISSTISGKAFLDNTLEIDAQVWLKDSFHNEYKLTSKNDLKYFAPHVSYLPQKYCTSLMAIHYQDDVCFGFEGKYPRLPGKDDIEKDRYAANKIHSICEQLELWAHLKTKSKKTSYGETRRIEFACVLSPHSEIVVLDEPYSGLDNYWAKKLTEIINHYIETYESIWIITSNKPSESYSLIPDTQVDLNFSDENIRPFEIISETVEQLFSTRINRLNNIQLEEIFIKRKGSKEKIIELSQINIYPGIVNWFIGNNGTGKSTLLETLSGSIYSGRFFEIKVKGKINGNNINGYLPKQPNTDTTFLCQSPYNSFVYTTVLQDLAHYTFYSRNPNYSSIENKLALYWGSFERKADAFSFGQLKFIQLLLISKNSKIVIIDEPMLGLNPILHNLMFKALSSIANTGRIVIASIESDLVDKNNFHNYFTFPEK